MKMAESYPNRLKTLGKGEIAHYEQFLLFPQCFQKAKMMISVLERVEKNVGKGENVGMPVFSFPKIF